MIYIVRHGQTDWNKLGKNQGQTDIPLNETGINQAYELKEVLKDYNFDLVFSSPLKRALETARIVVGDKVITDDRLKERGNGILEGKTHDEIIKIVGTGNLYTDLVEDNTLGIESLDHIQERVNSFFDEILDKYKGKNILIVTHAGTIINIRYYFEKVSDTTVLKNCEVLKYDN